MNEILRAISIQQPWAWCIVRPDVTDPLKRKALDPDRHIKLIENRSWPCRYRGQLLIHAAKTVDYEAFGIIEDEFDIRIPPATQLGLGGFIGVVTMIDCLSSSSSPWFNGPYGHVYDNARPLQLMPWRGQLGIFEVPELILAGNQLQHKRQGSLL